MLAKQLLRQRGRRKLLSVYSKASGLAARSTSAVEEAGRDIVNYLEMFYNPKRCHGYANDVSPVEFENQYFNRLQSV